MKVTQNRYLCTFSDGEKPVVGEVSEKARDIICDEKGEHFCDCSLIQEIKQQVADESGKLLYLLIPAVSAPIVIIVMVAVACFMCKNRRSITLKEEVQGDAAGGEQSHIEARAEMDTEPGSARGYGRGSVAVVSERGSSASGRGSIEPKPKIFSPSKLVFHKDI